MALALIAMAALGIAAVSLVRLSRLPPPRAAVEERTFATLRAGDVVLVPQGDYLVEARETLGQGQDRAELVALRSGRDRRWLLAREAGAVALLASRPATVDLDRALAMHDGKRVERATVELLPGA